MNIITNFKERQRAIRDINGACESIIAHKKRGGKGLNGDGLTIDQRIAQVKQMYNNLSTSDKKKVKYDVDKL